MLNYGQNSKVEKMIKKIEKLPQPMSLEFFEKCKKAIIEASPLGVISRTKLSKLCFFISSNTMRNLDNDPVKEGIKNPKHVGARNYVYYTVENTLEYIEREYRIKPQQRIDKAKEELEKLLREEEEKRKQQERRTSKYYKTGELK